MDVAKREMGTCDDHTVTCPGCHHPCSKLWMLEGKMHQQSLSITKAGLNCTDLCGCCDNEEAECENMSREDDEEPLEDVSDTDSDSDSDSDSDYDDS